jgi:predicted secreted protein
MAKRTIKFSLSPESINNALDQLGVYKEQFEAKKHMMMEVIVARGVQIVKEELEALVYSQEGQEYHQRFT